ncbi:hypothetical protein [Amycolatopsis samaneae]|uniref:Uncharacterized protein n=1 Tax=Amycolatopsis samaneae TaxID=664691 RepID=A0ABW5GN78_9PSEU
MWLVECPFFWDQGQLRPLVTESGKVVLFCDSCSTVWCSPDDVADVDAERYTSPSGPDWETRCGDHVRPGTTRWATREDLVRVGWDRLDWQEG